MSVFIRRSALILLLLTAGLQEAQSQSRVGTTAGTFLTLGAGARGAALGSAYTAIATGPDALFWNPGGAARAYRGRQRGGVLFSHNKWFADIEYNAAAVVVPITGSAVLGLSMASVDYGRMEVRTVSSPEGTGQTFGANDLSMGLTFAMPLTPSFFFGTSVKYVHQSIRDMSAKTMAVDFGFVLETRYLNGMQVAASIMNFGGKMRMEGVNAEIKTDLDRNNAGNSESVPARLYMNAWDLPLSFKFGVAVPVVNMDMVRVQLLADAHQTNDNNLNSDFGAEFEFYTNTVAFDARIGYKDAFLDNVDTHTGGFSLSQLSYGVGLDVQVTGVRFGFDFALVPFELLEDTKTFDFRVYF